MSNHLDVELTCDEFLDAYSDLRDGLLAVPDQRAMQGHLASCSSCRRYDRVLRTGVELLKEMDEDREDSGSGLAFGTIHRLALDGVRRKRSPAPRSVPALTGVAAAVIVAMAIAAWWTPGFIGSGTPELDLAPVVAAAPSPRPLSGAGFLRPPAPFPFETAPTGLQSLSRSLLHFYGGPAQSRAVNASVTSSPQLD